MTGRSFVKLITFIVTTLKLKKPQKFQWPFQSMKKTSESISHHSPYPRSQHPNSRIRTPLLNFAFEQKLVLQYNISNTNKEDKISFVIANKKKSLVTTAQEKQIVTTTRKKTGVSTNKDKDYIVHESTVQH